MAIQKYNPASRDMSGQIAAQGMMNVADLNRQTMTDLGNNISNALTTIASSYAENKGMEAQASSYDKVGEILGSSMFAGNNQVGSLLGDLRKEKNAKKKIYGYQALFNMAGPISNSMMAQQRVGTQQYAPYARQQINNANIQAEEGPAGDYSYIE